MFYLLISNSIVVSHAPLDSASYSQAFRVSQKQEVAERVQLDKLNPIWIANHPG